MLLLGPIGNFFLMFWWLLAPLVLFFILRSLWMNFIRTKFLSTVPTTILEIQIPKEVEQSPKVAEQIFAGLHGIQSNPNFVERNFYGKIQLWFGLEIVGAQGKIHFFIHTPKDFQDLVEAQIYAQYPDVEIKEVQDYTKNLPQDLPDKDINLWGTEFKLIKKDAYPIRTYPEFLDLDKKTMVDPLSGITEILSNTKEGEQIWLQILIRPTGSKWKEEAELLVNKLIGRKVTSPGMLGKIMEELRSYGEYSIETLMAMPSGEVKISKATEEALKKLTPGEQEVVKAIERNIAKIGFETKIRFIYLARRDKFSSANVSAIIGAFKQFSTQNLNGFRPDKKTKTSIDYFFKKSREDWRKRSILNKYRKRNFRDKIAFVFNTEELATIYHFPGMLVKAPMMPRIEAKKGEPPAGLPVH